MIHQELACFRLVLAQEAHFDESLLLVAFLRDAVSLCLIVASLPNLKAGVLADLFRRFFMRGRHFHIALSRSLIAFFAVFNPIGGGLLSDILFIQIILPLRFERCFLGGYHLGDIYLLLCVSVL